MIIIWYIWHLFYCSSCYNNYDVYCPVNQSTYTCQYSTSGDSMLLHEFCHNYMYSVYILFERTVESHATACQINTLRFIQCAYPRPLGNFNVSAQSHLGCMWSQIILVCVFTRVILRLCVMHMHVHDLCDIRVCIQSCLCVSLQPSK